MALDDRKNHDRHTKPHKSEPNEIYRFAKSTRQEKLRSRKQAHQQSRRAPPTVAVNGTIGNDDSELLAPFAAVSPVASNAVCCTPAILGTLVMLPVCRESLVIIIDIVVVGSELFGGKIKACSAVAELELLSPPVTELVVVGEAEDVIDSVSSLFAVG